MNLSIDSFLNFPSCERGHVQFCVSTQKYLLNRQFIGTRKCSKRLRRPNLIIRMPNGLLVRWGKLSLARFNIKKWWQNSIANGSGFLPFSPSSTSRRHQRLWWPAQQIFTNRTTVIKPWKKKKPWLVISIHPRRTCSEEKVSSLIVSWGAKSKEHTSTRTWTIERSTVSLKGSISSIALIWWQFSLLPQKWRI